MPLKRVTAAQFDESGELTVRHVPTGRSYSTYRYEVVPAEIVMNVSGRSDRDDEGNDYDLGEIEALAVDLLKRKLRP